MAETDKLNIDSIIQRLLEGTSPKNCPFPLCRFRNPAVEMHMCVAVFLKHSRLGVVHLYLWVGVEGHISGLLIQSDLLSDLFRVILYKS